MKCRVWYKPDGRVSVFHAAEGGRRQLNLSEVREAEAAARARVRAQNTVTEAQAIEAKAKGAAKTEAAARTKAAKAAVGPPVTIPSPVHETNQVFLDRVCVKAAQSSQEMLDQENARANPDPDKVALLAGCVLVGLPFDDIDPATLPDRKDREKWRGSKGVGVAVDPSVITPAERRKTLEDSIDSELAKPTPDTLAVVRMQRQLDKGEF